MPLTISPPLHKESYAKTLQPAALTAIPFYVYAVSFAALFTIIGITWDISWHTTIGRDKFLSPPHLLIYLGAIFGGLFSGLQVLWNTFRAGPVIKNSLVKVWGVFYSSLGALFCIWGALAMLTSAPFDDWWHNTYGLDVVILSPPHTLLGLGMLFLEFGACVSICKYLNQLAAASDDSAFLRKQRNTLRFLFVISAASLLSMVCTLLTDYIDARHQRDTVFYIVASAAVLLFLPAFGRALRMKWGMTAAATGYFFILAISNWVLQLFPGTPKLGPILNPVTHFQPGPFPLLLFVPALLMDVIMQRVKVNDWLKSLLLSFTFVALLLAVQYPFSGFLLQSPNARNAFFGSASWYYGADPDWEFRYKFLPEELQPLAGLARGVGIAFVTGFFITRISLRWGKWMQSIQR